MLAVADDRELAPELEAERLIEPVRATGIVIRYVVCRERVIAGVVRPPLHATPKNR